MHILRSLFMLRAAGSSLPSAQKTLEEFLDLMQDRTQSPFDDFDSYYEAALHLADRQILTQRT